MNGELPCLVIDGKELSWHEVTAGKWAVNGEKININLYIVRNRSTRLNSISVAGLILGRVEDRLVLPGFEHHRI